jgi:hypothetical protein
MDTNTILNRIDNLISKDSTVLKEFDDKIVAATKKKESAAEEAKSFASESNEIQSDIDEIAKVSELSERFANLDAYLPGLKKLGDSTTYIDKLNAELKRIPEQIEELENKIKELSDKKNTSEQVVKASEDELSKLDVDLSDAKRYQNNLIELINLAKSGEINKTREEVQETLTHVGFKNNEAIKAAKIILFPEDELIPYFNRAKDKQTINDEPTVAPIIENYPEPELSVTPIESPEINTELVTNNEDAVEPEVESISLDDLNDSSNEIPDIKANEDIQEDEPVEEPPKDPLAEIKDVLTSIGLDPQKYSIDDLNSLSNADINIIKNNVDFLVNQDIKKDITYQNICFLTDQELNDKYNYIIKELNKTPADIKINPLILVSYSLNDFKKLVDVARNSGIDPTAIPLSVYLKGLQNYLQNYIALNGANIIIDSNELAKFGNVLTISPNEFNKVLQVIEAYHLTLKKNDGKVALMLFTKEAKELYNKINLLIENNEFDLIKFYPEVLMNNVNKLINRLNFIKENHIPYKASARGITVYQPYVFKQDILEQIVEKKLDLHDKVTIEDNNNNLSKLVSSPELITLLNEMAFDDAMLAKDMDNYREVINNYRDVISEDDIVYSINDLNIAKNKVNINLNYLLNNKPDVNIGEALLVSLAINSHISSEDLNKLAITLKVK